MYRISPEYFQAAYTALLAGRAFTWHDDEKAARVAVINQEFARKIFGSVADAIRKRYKMPDGTRIQVVGVVEDGKYLNLTEDPQSAMFFPVLQAPSVGTNLIIRWRRDPQQLAAAIRSTLRNLDAALPSDIETWNQELQLALFPSRMATVSLGVLGAMGAVLSITGIFGMAAYSISKRLKELGIRIALGAQRNEVLRAALGRALRLLVFGSTAGLILGILASRVLALIVYHATPRDPLVLAGVVLAMALVGLLATWIPAQRGYHSILRHCFTRNSSSEPGRHKLPNWREQASELVESGLIAMEAKTERPTWKIALAFAIIYFVWGSTFLAIRVGVREVPPFLLAAMRFLVAGLVLYGWMIVQGERSPRRREWMSVFILAVLIFVFDYGLVFWAEQRVTSGIAAVMMAVIPVFMAMSEIIFLRTQKLTLRLAIALLTGIGGVAVLMSRSLNLGGAPIDSAGAVALIIAAMSWSVSSALTRKLPLPQSKVMSSGAQMLAGGVLLAVAAAALGEFRNFRPWTVSCAAWLSLLYLIVAGSIVAFTAYVWLIHHESPTKVGTYAYVNPIVAVLVGYFLAGETLGLRTILGTVFVLISVVVITTTRVKRPVATLAMEETR
jgi:drug/metabolite transporter (DMT)-like permease